MEGQRNLNVRNVERNIMDSVGHGATHRLTKIHRKEDGKETEKETAREPRRVESSKEEKAETKGKEKVKERRDNVSTKSQAGRAVDRWILGTMVRTMLERRSRHCELAGRSLVHSRFEVSDLSGR